MQTVSFETCLSMLSGSRTGKGAGGCEGRAACSPVRTVRARTRLSSSSLSQTAGHRSIADGALSDHGSDQGISTSD